MERQRREEELKNRSSKKGHEAEQAILNRVGSFLGCNCFWRLEQMNMSGYVALASHFFKVSISNTCDRHEYGVLV